MQKALNQAKLAYKNQEVPIGCVIVHIPTNSIIARGYNKRHKLQNAIKHAEIVAIEKACKKLNSWRLDDCVIYVTLEPCIMCAGAICNARLNRVVFGAYEAKSGGIASKYNLLTDNGLNYKGEFEGGVMKEECAKLMQQFFANARQRNSSKNKQKIKQ